MEFVKECHLFGTKLINCEILCRSANEFLAKDGDTIVEDIELYGKIENALILLRHGRKPA